LTWALTALCREILDRLNSLPGVLSASESLVTPISGYMWGTDFYLKKNGGPKGEDANAFMNFVSPGYFATLRSPLLAGRNFDEHDVAGAPPVVIISETMARRFYPRSDPVGQYLLMHDFLTNHRERMTLPIEVVGVLKDTKYKSLRERAQSIVYFPLAQAASLTDPPIFEIRTAAQPSSLARAAEQAITGLNKDISLNFRSLESQVDDSLRQEHLLATLSGFFGALALLLAMIGLYGVLAYMVTGRSKEIGVRITLGAQRSSILRLILSDLGTLLVAGITAGIGISLWATRLVENMLFGLGARDGKTMLLAVIVLVSVALFAGYLPARQATRVDPMVTLRYE
jgi:predicted permease